MGDSRGTGDVGDRDHLEDICLYLRMILKWIVKKGGKWEMP
jgi:hypothetical protein